MSALRLELDEGSGPVAPPYQYTLALSLVGDGEGARVTCERTGPDAGKGELKLSPERTRAFLAELDALGIEKAGGDFIGAKRKNVGVSFNRFELTRGDKVVLCEYLVNQLDDDDFAPARVLARVHELAKEVLAQKSEVTAPDKSR